MKIKIESKNEAAIEAALKAINGRAASFCVTTLGELKDLAERAERRLKDIAKARRTGVAVEYMPRGSAANRYKYRSASTIVQIERFSTGWFLTSIKPGQVWPKSSERFAVYVTEDQAMEAVRNSGLTIRPGADVAPVRSKQITIKPRRTRGGAEPEPAPCGEFVLDGFCGFKDGEHPPSLRL